MSYKITPLLTYEQGLSAQQHIAQIHNLPLQKQWCYGNDRYHFDVVSYGKIVTTKRYNITVYKDLYHYGNINQISPVINVKQFKKCFKPVTNNTSFYLVERYNDNVCEQALIVKAYVTGEYAYTITKTDCGCIWPPFIPESYKSQIKYVPFTTQYKPLEINNSNIHSDSNNLYINKKIINKYGYYNDCDMYNIQSDTIIIYIPFHILNTSYINEKYQILIKQYIESNKYIHIISDNEQLKRHCKIVIFDHIKLLRENKIIANDHRIYTTERLYIKPQIQFNNNI